jgi:hypothetical protein
MHDLGLRRLARTARDAASAGVAARHVMCTRTRGAVLPPARTCADECRRTAH